MSAKGFRTPTGSARLPLHSARLTRHGLERLRQGHPWVYRTDVAELNGGDDAGAAAPTAADMAPAIYTLLDERDRPFVLADSSPHSKIAFRLLSRDVTATIDRAFWRQRLAEAVAFRQRYVQDSNACRLVWGEADGLPGLVLDQFDQALSLQTLTWPMAQRQALLVELIEELLQPSVLVERNDASVRALEGLPERAGLLLGEGAQVTVRMNGLSLAFDLLSGQKTGGFLDQRENWAAAARWLPRREGSEALDVFTYQGGFALHLAGACRTVEAVDSSRPALEAADANAARNQLDNITFVEANAFDLLKEYDQTGRRFDCIVLDPPAFAKSRTALAAAERGYKEINLRALKMLRPGGLLVSCSCSHHMSEALLAEIIAAAAQDAHRELLLLERRTQAIDHPILLAVPETYYLKAFYFLVR